VTSKLGRWTCAYRRASNLTSTAGQHWSGKTKSPSRGTFTPGERLLARDGKLFSATLSADLQLTEKELADFDYPGPQSDEESVAALNGPA
jgi:hypothetical protein